MAKLTVYAPDELPERLRSLNPDANISALLQEAMRHEIGRLETTSDLKAVVAQADLSPALASLTAMRTHDYEAGYKWGVELASRPIPENATEIPEAQRDWLTVADWSTFFASAEDEELSGDVWGIPFTEPIQQLAGRAGYVDSRSGECRTWFGEGVNAGVWAIWHAAGRAHRGRRGVGVGA